MVLILKTRPWCSICSEVTPPAGLIFEAVRVVCTVEGDGGRARWVLPAGDRGLWVKLHLQQSWVGPSSPVLILLLVHLRLFSHCYWDKSVLGVGQQIPEVSCGNTDPGHRGRESGETPPCGSELLDQIKLSHVTSPSVFCGSGLCPCPVSLPVTAWLPHPKLSCKLTQFECPANVPWATLCDSSLEPWY